MHINLGWLYRLPHSPALVRRIFWMLRSCLARYFMFSLVASEVSPAEKIEGVIVYIGGGRKGAVVV